MPVKDARCRWWEASTRIARRAGVSTAAKTTAKTTGRSVTLRACPPHEAHSPPRASSAHADRGRRDDCRGEPRRRGQPPDALSARANRFVVRRAAARRVASGINSSVSGGRFVSASVPRSSVCGDGENHTTGGEVASIRGGLQSHASGADSCVGGGYRNAAEFNFSSIFGGKELAASKGYEAIP